MTPANRGQFWTAAAWREVGCGIFGSGFNMRTASAEQMEALGRVMDDLPVGSLDDGDYATAMYVRLRQKLGLEEAGR